MTDQEREEQRSSGGDSQSSTQGGTGDPGRTPGKAEGDERTADEDLQRQRGASS